ncbi:MAG TPA: HAMP domain-containing sensor histidine kinase [Actinomycetales bacterium]|nr:HAMP domain-containing sensor histidine kinase [Actinomycetales bacterium]
MSGALKTWPLRAKLILIAWLAVILALGVSGPLIVVLVRSSLIDQVDVQLQQAASDVAQTAASELSTGGADPDARLPSDYYVQFQIGSTRTALQAGSAPSARGAVPNIPDLSPNEVGRGLEPATVDSVNGSPQWRMVALPVAVHSQAGVAPATVAVALPLTSVEATISQITVVILVAGVAVLLLVSGLSWFAVDRALRPLTEVESTALAIADGDLSRRVEVAPLSTEVGRLSYALNTMLAQIERAVAQRDISQERLRQFVADASHELRTPLAVLRGYGELYRQGGVPRDEVAPTMERIESEAKRLGEMVEDLLLLTRLDENEAPSDAEFSAVDLRDLVDDAAADLRALDPQRDVAVVAWGPAAAGGDVPRMRVRANRDQLRQVLTNLVGNVVQHTPAGTPVEFALGLRDSATAVLEVRDHGPGVSQEDALRMFDRFRRLDAARSRQHGGAGLGLSIVEAIVRAHGGSVRALPRSADADAGLVVRVELPLANDPPVEWFSA